LGVPNPGAQTVRLLLDGPADSVELGLYSTALVKVGQASLSGPLGPGWVSISLPWAGLPPGLYYARASALGQGRRSLPSAPVRLLRL